MLDTLAKDLKHVWHPCSQMKDYKIFPPQEIIGARGSYIYLSNGNKIIDAISSWWCKSLGHQHPRLKEAMLRQADQFEHVIFANTTHRIIADLSEQLAALCPPLDKVFYAGDGSCAVEVAMKMSLHARQIMGQSTRTVFVALENAYHGETVGALSVSDLGLYRAPYQSLCFPVKFIQGVPYVHHQQDPLWRDCAAHWRVIEVQLERIANQVTAIIIEPIVQGAAGMKIYSQDFLARLREWTSKHGIHLIADEIMTGIGRTGKMLACEHAQVEPDFICLAKGLTSGWLPFSAVLTRQAIYDVFYDDYVKGKSFLHSHTYSGNALGAAIALQVLHVMKEEELCQRAEQLGKYMYTAMCAIACRTGRIANVRQIGALVAADLIGIDCSQRRLGFELFQQAVQQGAWLRPLGNTIYWLPPLNSAVSVIDDLAEITEKVITTVN